jgi:hypothetical protein
VGGELVMMPDVWQIHECAPCSSVLACGGCRRDRDCPSCGLPREWIAEHRAEAVA